MSLFRGDFFPMLAKAGWVQGRNLVADVPTRRIGLPLQVVPSARRTAVLCRPEPDINAWQAAPAGWTLWSRKWATFRVAIGRPETYDASFETRAARSSIAVLSCRGGSQKC